MLGWMLVFLLVLLGGATSAANGGLESTFVLTSCVVFGFLLVVSALTILLRGRT
jgi:hypothetical protein